MSSYDTWLNVLTGISRGSFDKIYIRDANGNMVDLLTLLGSIGGGLTDVISQSSELVVTTNGTTKILTLNLGGYLSSSHEAGKVGNGQGGYPPPIRGSRNVGPLPQTRDGGGAMVCIHYAVFR